MLLALLVYVFELLIALGMRFGGQLFDVDSLEGSLCDLTHRDSPGYHPSGS